MADAPKAETYLPGIPCHVIQRGNNKDVCFAAEEDCQAYLEWLRDRAERYGCTVHAYVLMTNYVHLLVTPQDREGVSRLKLYLALHRNGAKRRVMRTGRCSGYTWTRRSSRVFTA